MDRKQEFSIAAKRDENQKRLAEDQERMRQIEKIRDANERAQHEQGISLRNEKLKIEKERAEREERDIVRREVQKKMDEKHELHLRMKKAEGLSPEKKRDMIERAVSHNVRISHGAELDSHRAELQTDMNREIDDGIKKSLERQAEKERENATPSVRRPWESASRDQDVKRPWESDLSRDQGSDRTRGR